MQKKKMRHTLRDDLRQGGFIKNLKREFQALQAFYLDEEEREQLRNMGWFRKSFKEMIWLFKGLFYNMTPFRRLLFVAAVILFFSISAQINGNQVDVQRNGSILSVLIFIFILMLEVKDKLLATSELRHGRAVQEALMPEAQPRFDGWDIYLYSYPANDVGGDLIDFNTLGDGTADIALGDVAGKGLPAALFMAKLQSTLRAISSPQTDLSTLISQTNHIFCRDGIAGRFASLFYIRLNELSGKLQFVNAGHLPALLISGKQVKELDKGDPAIGLKADIAYRQHALNLESGDFLFLYSDGLTEARNNEDFFFGDQRLHDVLHAASGGDALMLANRILNTVSRFVKDTPQSDDLSFAILRRV